MTKKKKKKEQNNLYIAIIGVIAIITIIAGSTYAYWSWQSDPENITNVSVTVKGATLTCYGTNVTSVTMRPTNDCTNSTKALIGEFTVTVVNETATEMRATPRLDVTLTPNPDNPLTFDDTASNPDLAHLHWAIVDITSSTSKTCASTPDYQGTFNAVEKVTLSTTSSAITVNTQEIITMSENTKTTMNITNMSMKDSSITNKYAPSNYQTDSTLSFVASAASTDTQGVTTAATTTKKYRVYAWLDDSYVHTNTGDSVTDPMQDLNVLIQCSPNSTLIQE